MKYLRQFNFFEDKIQNLDLPIHETRVEKVIDLKIPDPEHGDLKLSVFPFENNGKWVSLPEGFKLWEESLNKIVKMIPLQKGANTHYVTIDSKFFTKDEYLRREGIHADGNFCVDPNFVSLDEKKKLKRKYKSSWGGASPMPTWGGARLKDKENDEDEIIVKEDNSHVSMDWVLPYNITIPVGDYISEEKGGIFSVSTEVGCQAWQGTFKGEVLSEGSYELMESQLTDDKKIIFEKDNLYFMTSNTPHETLLINKGTRRTFMRVTLNHQYNNEALQF